MKDPNNHRQTARWFQFSLRTLLLMVLIVAAYFAGFATSQRLAEKAIREAREKATVELEKAQETALQAILLAEEQRDAIDRANLRLRGSVLTK